jgi:hypothetical protein
LRDTTVFQRCVNKGHTLTKGRAMVIELGQGFRIDASDGLNWILTQDVAKAKRPIILGYHSNLRNAIRGAMEAGLHQQPATIPLSRVDALCQYVADEILSSVTISKVDKQHFGKVLKFTPRTSLLETNRRAG